MNRILMDEVWNYNNAIRGKVLDVWRNNDDNKSFKQYCNTKEGKQMINDISKRYIEKAKDQLEVKFISGYVKGDKLYITIESNESNIIERLSFQCNTNLWFSDVSFMLDSVG